MDFNKKLDDLLKFMDKNPSKFIFYVVIGILILFFLVVGGLKN